MSDICVVGGIAADIEGNPYGQLIHGDSNPGTISISYGGVGRNITENLARLSADVAFISMAGDDFAGRGAVRELADLSVNVDHLRLSPDENTAMYISILNLMGEMELALCNMDVLERIPTALIDDALPLLRKAKMVGLDTNLTPELLAYATEQLAGVPLFLDPVSAAKAERAKEVIGRFHTIKPNRMEAEVLSGLSILNQDELMAAGNWFCEQGVQRIFITLSGGGVYYKEGAEEGILRPAPVCVVSATGAGDAFSAAILDGFARGLSVRDTAQYGMTAAALALEAKTAVNPNMCREEVTRRMASE